MRPKKFKLLSMRRLSKHSYDMNRITNFIEISRQSNHQMLPKLNVFLLNFPVFISMLAAGSKLYSAML